METETPLTDAAEIGHAHKVVPSDFARAIERQLRALVTACNEYGGGASISHPRYTRQLSEARKFLENIVINPPIPRND